MRQRGAGELSRVIYRTLYGFRRSSPILQADASDEHMQAIRAVTRA